MNRRDKKWLTTPAGMKRAAMVTAERRGKPWEHDYVLGGFRLVRGVVTLYGIEMGAGFNIIQPHRLTNDSRRWYRWRTKQAAHKYARSHGLREVRVLSLLNLDVLRMDAPGVPLVRTTSADELLGRESA